MKGDLAKFFINVRHRNVFCIFSSQTFRASVPRQLRSNVKVYCLFQCKSAKFQKDIAEDMVGKVSVEDFLRLWNFATAEKYNAFVVDYEKDENEMFSKNFDTRLLLNSAEDAET